RTGLPLWVTLPAVFVCVAAVMATIAEGAARVFRLFEPLEAYRLDIIGSILGIAAFSLISFLGLPPLAWGVLAAAVFVAVLPRERVAVPAVVALGVLVVALGWESKTAIRHPLVKSWSPYY